MATAPPPTAGGIIDVGAAGRDPAVAGRSAVDGQQRNRRPRAHHAQRQRADRDPAPGKRLLFTRGQVRRPAGPARHGRRRRRLGLGRRRGGLGLRLRRSGLCGACGIARRPAARADASSASLTVQMSQLSSVRPTSLPAASSSTSQPNNPSRTPPLRPRPGDRRAARWPRAPRTVQTGCSPSAPRRCRGANGPRRLAPRRDRDDRPRVIAS